jgi:hypothetical protein
MKATGTQQTLDEAEVFVNLVLGDRRMLGVAVGTGGSPALSTSRGMGAPAAATVAASFRLPTRSGAPATA